MSSWLRENICREEKKTRGRYVGVAGYWNYRLATTTEEENYIIEMQSIDAGLPVSSFGTPSEPLFGPSILPHYTSIYVP